MLLIAGTVPDKDIGLAFGEARLKNGILDVSGVEISRTQGTAAMISAAAVTLDYLGIKTPPCAAIAGDIGNGTGSRKLYKYLISELPGIEPDVLALHYLMPIIPQMVKLVDCAEKMSKKPTLIADAGSMYAVKAAGLSKKFALMTPDRGEMSFLADPEATHPAYIRHHLMGNDGRGVPELINDLYQNGSAPDTLMVKGSTDYIANKGRIVETVSKPDVPEMEAIGGTGDTHNRHMSSLFF